MEQKRQVGDKVIPDNLDQLLTDLQLRGLRHLKNRGWKTKFVRRPLFQQILPVMINSNGDKMAVIAPDGRLQISQFSQQRAVS